MSRERRRVDGQRTRDLNGIRQFEAQRGSQSRGAFRNIEIKRDRMP